MPPEPHVAAWEGYAADAAALGAFEALRRRLVQLRFPVRAVMSASPGYRAATRRGEDPDQIAEATGLVLRRPDDLRLYVYPGVGGPLPALETPDHGDFADLLRALAMRGEPEHVPDTMGSALVSGVVNWDRVRAYRDAWARQHPGACSETDWAAEFRLLREKRELYHDTFALLAEGPYSGVPAVALGLGEGEWTRLSREVRLGHESAHYLSLRLRGRARDPHLEEVAADYAGIVWAVGRYRPEWALRFLGLEGATGYRRGGRLENYGEGADAVTLHAHVRAAIANLAAFDAEYGDAYRDLPAHGALLAVLVGMSLADMAAPGAEAALSRAVDEARQVSEATSAA